MDELVDDLRPSAARNPVLRYLRIAMPVKSLATGAFGFAMVGCLLLLDVAYALAWSLTGTVALGSAVFTGLGLFSLRRHWKRAVIGYGIAFVLSVAVVISVLLAGVFTYGYMPQLEAMGHSIQIKQVLEHARAKGVTAEDWKALEDAGLVGPERRVEDQYFYRDHVSWTYEFDEHGKFQGRIQFAGYTLHNIPDCEVTFNERDRPVATKGDYNKYLPVRPRSME